MLHILPVDFVFKMVHNLYTQFTENIAYFVYKLCMKTGPHFLYTLYAKLQMLNIFPGNVFNMVQILYKHFTENIAHFVKKTFMVNGAHFVCILYTKCYTTNSVCKMYTINSDFEMLWTPIHNTLQNTLNNIIVLARKTTY